MWYNSANMKTTTKKAKRIISEVPEVKEEVISEAKPVEKVVKKQFHIYIKLNGVEYETDTNDIAEFIMSTKPNILYTTFDFKVTKGNVTVSRFLYLRDGRKLFSNPTFLQVFVNNLLV